MAPINPRISVAAVGFLWLLIPPVLASPSLWTTNGPPSSYISQVVVDPAASGMTYVLDSNFLFKSLDGGVHWTSAMGELTRASRIALDPSGPSSLFAVNPLCLSSSCDAVFRSTDGGESWTPRTRGLPPDSQDDPQEPDDLAISASEPGTVYALYSFRGLYRTTDSGETWTALSLPAEAAVGAVAVAPDASGTLFVGRDPGGLFRSHDHGESWTTLGVGLIPPLRQIVVDPSSPTTVYAVTSGGLFRSEDGGDSWAQRGSGEALVLAIDPKDSSTLYAGAADGVWKSSDAGQSWRRMGSGMSSCFAVQALAISGQMPSIIYAGTAGDGLFSSKDAGETWFHADQGLPPDVVYILVVAPNESGTIYAESSALFRSFDAGAQWLNVCPEGYTPTLLAVHPASPETVFGARGSCDFGYLCFGEIKRSTDGGASWEVLLDTGAVTAIQIDPRRPDILYAGVSTGTRLNPPASGSPRHAGVIKSTDGGSSWIALSLQNLNEDILQIRVDPSVPDTIYVTASNSLDSGSAPPDVGIWKSADGGVTWTKVSNLEVNVLDVDPKTTGLLYAGTAQGVFRSVDGGQTWDATAFTDPVTALVIDPSASSTVFVGTSGSGVFRSGDRGNTWSAFNEGLTDLSVTVLAIDSLGTFLHAGTSEGGVFDVVLPRDRLPVQHPTRRPGAIPVPPR